MLYLNKHPRLAKVSLWAFHVFVFIFLHDEIRYKIFISDGITAQNFISFFNKNLLIGSKIFIIPILKPHG